MPKELRRALLWGPGLARLLMVALLLSIVFDYLLPGVLAIVFRNSLNDPAFLKIQEYLAFLSLAILLWYGVRLYLDYRRLARWIKVEADGHCYQVPQTLALRSAFLVPAIMDYFHKHFSSQALRPYLLEHRSPWQPILVSPLSGKVYVLPRSRWQRFIHITWNSLLWSFTKWICKFVDKLSPTEPKPQVSFKERLRKLSQINLKELLSEIGFESFVFGISMIVGFIGAMLIMFVITLPVWICLLLGLDLKWGAIATNFWAPIVIVGALLYLRWRSRSKRKGSTSSKALHKLVPKGLLGLFRKSKKNDEQAQKGEESEVRGCCVIQCDTAPKPPEKAETKSPAQPENQPDNQTKDSEPQEEQEDIMIRAERSIGSAMALARATHDLGRIFQIAAEGMQEIFFRDPLWMHSLGMGFLLDFPTDRELIRRYKALPAEAKDMLHAIMVEVLERFNDPQSTFTAEAYPERREKEIYLTEPGTNEVFRRPYDDHEAIEKVEHKLLPALSDYHLPSPTETPNHWFDRMWQRLVKVFWGDEEEKLVVVGYDGGYRLSDYARLFRSSLEMKASFWAAYLAAWRLVGIVSGEPGGIEYHGEPLTLPVLRQEGYVEVRKLKRLATMWQGLSEE